MNIWIIILLAIVQGATEFLPVSSSGHLVLLYKIFGINNERIFLSVILHLATLISVVIYYRKSIIKLIKQPFCHTNIMLAVSTLITCVIALVFKKFIENSFEGRHIGLGFIITAIILIISQLRTKESNFRSFDITNLNISLKQSIYIGVAQGLACFPAISRSGSTIASGLIVGCNKEEVTEFSFLLSIPIIIASTIMEIVDIINKPAILDFSFPILTLGFIIAIVVGLLSIQFMTKLVKKQKLYYFSFYLLLIAIVSFIV